MQEAGKKGYENRQDKWFGGALVNGVDEGTYALSLAKDQDYRHKNGKHVGTPDRIKILRAVNDIYGKNRTEQNIQDFFRRHYRQ